MKNRFIRTITSLLLLVFAWSCFGLNLGMIGHGGMESAAHEGHVSQHEAGCCGAGDNLAGTGSLDHHATDAFILPGLLILALFSILWSLRKYIWIIPKCAQQTRFYIRERWREICFISVVFIRLFSRGILHPKTW